MTTYPLSIRDVAPGEGFARLMIPEHEGFHTGGPWVSPDGAEIWKPLDGRPYANAEIHIPTDELDALCTMIGRPGFPANWRLEITDCLVDGATYRRRWLVRPVSYMAGSHAEDSPFRLPLVDVLAIEQGVRELNRKGWEINDPLVVGIDPGARPFIVDLSAAQRLGRFDLADEEWRTIEWMRQTGYGQLARLREVGKHLVGPLAFARQHGARYWRAHVYAAHWADALHATLPPGLDAQIVMRDEFELGREFSYPAWVVTPGPIPDDTARACGLVWAWGPVHPAEQMDPMTYRELAQTAT